MSLVWYGWANTSRTGTVSWYEIIRWSKSIFLQKLSQFFQCPSAAASLLEKSPPEMSSVAALKLSWDRFCLMYSTHPMVESMRVFNTERKVVELQSVPQTMMGGWISCCQHRWKNVPWCVVGGVTSFVQITHALVFLPPFFFEVGYVLLLYKTKNILPCYVNGFLRRFVI